MENDQYSRRQNNCADFHIELDPYLFVIQMISITTVLLWPYSDFELNDKPPHYDLAIYNYMHIKGTVRKLSR